MSGRDLTPARLEQLQGLFEAALEVPASARAAFVGRETGGDTALRDEVLALLAAHEGDSGLLSRPLVLRGNGAGPEDESRWLGVRVGPWLISRVIGSGGMGTVCEAQRADAQFEKRVAVKFLQGNARSPAAVQRFRDERQILASLNHPNVATLLDGGLTADGQPYLVMEYIDGEPITAWADAHQLSTRARAELFLQVCAAVEEAHRNLIVHRDLKPGNILVTSDGRVKLLDFGIARLLGSEPGALAATQGRLTASFTPGYAAPEQLRASPVSTATDVFSLGAVLYRLLTGRQPFATRANPDAAAAPAEIDPDLDAILARAMEVDRDRRYPAVHELRADIADWLAGRPVSARGGGRAYRLGKFLGRHRTGSIIGGVAIIAIVAASVTALWQSFAARRAADDLRQYNSFLMDVLRMSDPFSEGDDLTLSAALDRAAEAIDQRFAGRPDLSAGVRFEIGASMASRYRLDQAEAQLGQALAESTALFGAQDLRTLRVQESIAGLRLEQSRFAEAASGYQDVINRLEARRLRLDPLYATALGNLGNVYLQQERYQDADAALQRAADAAGRIPSLDAFERAGIISNLAHAAHGLEDYPRADQRYRDAAAAYLRIFPEGSPDLAILYNNHAMLHEDRGDIPAAIAMHRESLTMRRKVFRNQHPMVVVALSNLARLSLQTDDNDAALQHASEGAAMADRVYAEPNRFHPSVHATLAAAQLANEDVAAAHRSWARARDLLLKMPEAPPSTARWVEEVRGRICTATPADCPSAVP